MRSMIFSATQGHTGDHKVTKVPTKTPSMPMEYKGHLRQGWAGIVKYQDGRHCHIDMRLTCTPSGSWHCRLFCSIPLHPDPLWIHSTGKASGSGYNKPSAAAANALANAGFEFSDNIHGAGEEAVESALLGIINHFGAPIEGHLTKYHE